MSISVSSSKPSSKSNRNHKRTEAVIKTAVEPATSAPVAPPVNAPPQDPAPGTIGWFAAQALAHLEAIESSLKLDIVVAPNDKSQIRALARISDKAIRLASDIVTSAPSRFPDFAQLPVASEYVAAMAPVAARALELGAHIEKSLGNQRTPAAQQTLALYAVVKGLGRIVDNETMREKVLELKVEVAPKRKNPKPKVTKDEKAAKRLAKTTAKRVARAQKVLAAHGGAAPVGAAVAGSAEVAPVAAAAVNAGAPAASTTPATH